MLNFTSSSALMTGVALAASNNSNTVCPQSSSGHRVDSLPYYTPAAGDEFPCMYAGNMRSSSVYDNHFFYWLFQTTDTWSTDTPLVIYMNGGPGSTSMNALWMETGPLRVTQDDDFVVTYEPDLSW